MLISVWSSDVCSADLDAVALGDHLRRLLLPLERLRTALRDRLREFVGERVDPDLSVGRTRLLDDAAQDLLAERPALRNAVRQLVPRNQPHVLQAGLLEALAQRLDRKSTRLNSSHQ